MKILILSALFLVSAFAQTQKTDTAADHIQKGMGFYRAGEYARAVDEFQAAIQLDANSITARLDLGAAYMGQYVPGAVSVSNQDLWQKAIDSYQEVLQRDPNTEVALESLSSLFYMHQDMESAELYSKKVLAVNPDNKNAYYMVGVIAWTRFLPADRAARVQLDMKPDDPGPLTDRQVLTDLRDKFKASLDGGVQALEMALKLDPSFADAMSYMNLLLRSRADLADTAEEYHAQVATADEWLEKALVLKKKKA